MRALAEAVERAVTGSRVELPARLLALRLLSVRSARQRQSYWYKVHTREIIRRTMRPDSCGVDVGSHRGLQLLAMMQAAPNGRHIAVEPVSKLAFSLERRFPSVRVVRAAVSDRDGEDSFMEDTENPGLSALCGTDANVHTAGRRLQISTVTLDTLLDDFPVDFLKIDAMGSHLQAFLGAKKILATRRPHCVFTCRSNPALDQAAPAGAIWDLCNELDLRISLLRDWLAGKPSLSRVSFCKVKGHHPGSEFYFLLHPQRHRWRSTEDSGGRYRD